MPSAGFVRQVLVPEIRHFVPGQIITVGVFPVRGRSETVIRNRVDQDLVAKPGSTPVACHQGYDRSQVASRAVAADSDPGGIDIQGHALLGDPACGRVSIFGRGRKLMFRSQPVVDRQNRAAGAAGQLAAAGVMGIEGADDPASSGESTRGRETDLFLPGCTCAPGYFRPVRES